MMCINGNRHGVHRAQLDWRRRSLRPARLVGPGRAGQIMLKLLHNVKAVVLRTCLRVCAGLGFNFNLVFVSGGSSCQLPLGLRPNGGHPSWGALVAL